jgi:hypothetical protein
MANEEHLKILKQGKKIWNRWRKENPDIWPDLSEADLSRADLRETDLLGAHLTGANLGEANLWRADLTGANLSGTELRRANLSRGDLRGADLSQADLFRADLSEADLSTADLHGANLFRANLFRADLSRAHLGEADLSQAVIGLTTFADVDLSAVKGLDAIEHAGPSEISISTLAKSRGQIPEAFLRGCGVPDTFIAYMRSLTGKAFDYYSCFISYSTHDQAFAERLHADLQTKGVRCWFAPEDIAGGKKLYDQIDQAIRVHDKLLLVLSEHSIGSPWVMTEIRRARKAEAKDGQRKLFPIRLVGMGTLREWECFDADAGQDLAVEVREYHIPDFSTWKDHDAYQRAFDRLLRDLKASEAGIGAS